jgi:DNA invertase Pin-like site-specific DNA recombinase
MSGRNSLRVVGYARISEDRFDEQEGVDRQREYIDSVAERRRAELVEVFADNDRSASKPSGKRPAYDQMVAFLRVHRDIDAVVVKATSRLYREPMELFAMLPEFAGMGLMIWPESGDLNPATADGAMLAGILGVVDHAEAKRIAGRVADAAEQRIKRGRFSGGQRRFGYQQLETREVMTRPKGSPEPVVKVLPTGPLSLVPDEADAIRDGYKRLADGATLASVVRDWRGRGLVGPQGAKLTDVAVRDILLRPMNGGLVAFKGKIIPGAKSNTPTIVDPDLFLQVEAILRDPSRRSSVGRPATSMLAGTLKCGVCGERINARKRGHKRPDGSTTWTPIYRCREGHVSRTRTKLDQAIGALVVDRVIAQRANLLRPTGKPPTGTAAKAMAEAADLQSRIESYQRQAASFDPADLAAILRGLRADLAKAAKRLAKVAGRPASSALAGEKDVRSAWRDRTDAERRMVISEQIERITVGPGVTGTRTNTLENVKVTWKG